MDARALARAVRRSARGVSRRARIEVDWLASRRGRSDVALFHEFAPPPSGGGHQFLRALEREIAARGVAVEENCISGGTPACLFNSFNFDFGRLRRFARQDCVMVHRVDGPIGVYRGFDDETDRRIAEINRELADATVFQSRYSLEKHLELGLELRESVIISNTVDPAIFHRSSLRDPVHERRVRVIATSWSSNPRKGADVFGWLDRHLDPDRYEMTFVGQTAQRFERIRHVGPVDSHDVADLLRAHDVYVAASRDDPCSNALLEALACGLPAAYLDSGGHPELVGEGGLAFGSEEQLPAVLDRLSENLDSYRAGISVPSIASVADRYLAVLRLMPGARP